MRDGRTILVVEDDPELRGLIAEILADEGYAVLEAGDGREALRIARRSGPAAILADQGLPGLSGLELLERLRAGPATRRIPVILLSGLEPDRGGPRPDGVLLKPFDLDALLAHVERVLRAGAPAAASV